MYNRHEEYTGSVSGPAASVFEYLDDQTRLSAHMNKRSWKMGWGKMDLRLDDKHGRAIGSRIVLDGRVLGIRLFLDEVVTERVPPFRKTWETIGEPKLLVIVPYLFGMPDMIELLSSRSYAVAPDSRTARRRSMARR